MANNENTFVAVLKKYVESERFTLPVFSAVSLRLQLELVKKDPNLNAVERLIISDQSLSGNLLKIANSSLYCGLVETTSVRAAIVRLGVVELARIVSIDINRKMFRCRDAEIDAIMKKLWQHSLACAFTAGMLSKRLDFGVMQNEAFFTGLFHDLGKLLILKVIAEKKSKNPALAVPGDLLIGAMDLLHAEQGHLFLQQIKMPQIYTLVARDHHKADYDRGNYLLVLVRMANHICHQMEIGLKKAPELQLLQTEEAGRLNLAEADIEEIRTFLATTPALNE